MGGCARFRLGLNIILRQWSMRDHGGRHEHQGPGTRTTARFQAGCSRYYKFRCVLLFAPPHATIDII